MRDAQSPILKLEYSLAGGPWQLVYPADGLADSPEERYEIPLASDADAARIVVRATDLLAERHRAAAAIDRSTDTASRVHFGADAPYSSRGERWWTASGLAPTATSVSPKRNRLMLVEQRLGVAAIVGVHRCQVDDVALRRVSAIGERVDEVALRSACRASPASRERRRDVECVVAGSPISTSISACSASSPPASLTSEQHARRRAEVADQRRERVFAHRRRSEQRADGEQNTVETNVAATEPPPTIDPVPVVDARGGNTPRHDCADSARDPADDARRQPEHGRHRRHPLRRRAQHVADPAQRRPTASAQRRHELEVLRHAEHRRAPAARRRRTRRIVANARHLHATR